MSYCGEQNAKSIHDGVHVLMQQPIHVELPCFMPGSLNLFGGDFECYE